MKVQQLCDLLMTLPAAYGNANVYMQMRNESEYRALDPTLLHDIDEFVVDLEDDIVIIRTVLTD